MEKYYNLLVQLSLQQCTVEDYKDKEKVLAHNVATKKIIKLCSEIKNQPQYVIEKTLKLLLEHEDDRVKINASNLCFQINVFVEQAKLLLKEIVCRSEDCTLRFSAKMILESVL